MTALRSWMNSSLIVLTAVGLLVALAGLIRRPDGITAGLAVSTMLTILAVSMLRSSSTLSRNLLSALPGAMLAGTFVTAVGGSAGSIAQGLCSVGVAGSGIALLGLVASRRFLLTDCERTSESTAEFAVRPMASISIQNGFSTETPTPAAEPAGMREENSSPALFALVSTENPEECAEEETEEPHQHWSRTLSGSEDRLEGLLIAELQAGQKQRYLHVPFIPLFQSRPSAMCECEVEGEEEVIAELEQIHPYGARLSIRRRGSCSEPVRIRIHLFVTEPQKSARAA